MSPGTRRGPAPATGTGPNRHDTTAKQVDLHATTAHPHVGPRHVLAETHVVAGRVRSRLLLVVVCECGARHVHYGPLTMVAGVRQAACGRRYTLHTGYELSRVVA